MQETAKRENFRDQCQRISEILGQGHRLLDDLMGPEPATDAVPEPATDAVPEPATDAVPEPATNAVPEPTQSQGMVQELEIALVRIEGRAKYLALRLEVLCRQI